MQFANDGKSEIVQVEVCGVLVEGSGTVRSAPKTTVTANAKTKVAHRHDINLSFVIKYLL